MRRPIRSDHSISRPLVSRLQGCQIIEIPNYRDPRQHSTVTSIDDFRCSEIEPVRMEGEMRDLDVIVAGGGIGGLSLALSLHQAGIAVRVYEAVRAPAPLGVGINLQPTAVRELTELGLGDELAHTGLATRELSYFNKLGQLIHSEPRG